MRLDQALAEAGLCDSRARAQDIIKQGHVLVNGQPARKSSQKIADTDVLSLSGQEHPWVSRGGMKLAHALEHFALDVTGTVALDVGASTGGFTDVLLHNGAAKVFALDVGRDQLHEKLRADARVVNMEGTNARELEPEDVDAAFGVIVSDVSFISQRLALEAPLRVAREQASLSLLHASTHLILLVKPQFEVGKDKLPKDGVVKDEAEQQRACKELSAWVHAQGWEVQGITDSPITGPKGNKEFLLYATL